MSDHYHDPNDRQYTAALRQAAGPEFKTFVEFNETAMERQDGAVPRKYRELIAVAVGLTTQCVYCIEAHTKAAKAAGATEQELAETIFVTAAVRAGGATGHGRMALKFYKNS